MMIDWEDKQPAGPMPWGERVLLAIVVPISLYNFVIPFINLGRWAISLIH